MLLIRSITRSRDTSSSSSSSSRPTGTANSSGAAAAGTDDSHSDYSNSSSISRNLTSYNNDDDDDFLKKENAFRHLFRTSSPRSLLTSYSRKVCDRTKLEKYLLLFAAMVYFLLQCFSANVNGFALLYMRTNLPFIPDWIRDEPSGATKSSTTGSSRFQSTLAAQKTCFLQAYDQRSKDKYRSFVERNRAWAQAKGFTFYEYTKEYHDSRRRRERNSEEEQSVSANELTRKQQQELLPQDFAVLAHNIFPWAGHGNTMGGKEMPHFLKFHGMKYLMFSGEHNCDYVIYVDSDVVVEPNREMWQIPTFSNEEDVDMIFGNELFVAAMKRLENNPPELPFNRCVIQC